VAITSLWLAAAERETRVPGSRQQENKCTEEGRMREKRVRTAHARKKCVYRRKGFTRGRRGGGAKNRDGNAIRRTFARIYAPGRGRDANLPKMPSWFANLLETIFYYFAKF
jgi:hypothetical protein